MIGLGVFVFAILYIWLARMLVTKLPGMANTERSKNIVRIVVWLIVLWYPVIDPAISYVVYRTYAAQHAGVHIYETANDVDKVFLDGLFPSSVAVRENRRAFNTDGADRNDMAYGIIDYVGPGGVMYEEKYETGHNGRIVLTDTNAKYKVTFVLVANTRYYKSFKCNVLSREGNVLGIWQYVYWHGGGPMYIPIESSAHKAYDYSPKSSLSLAEFIHTVLKPTIAK